jgi:hypothetical protein
LRTTEASTGSALEGGIQCVIARPAPLAIITRVTTSAATPVAARIVKNQKRRLPWSTSGNDRLLGPGPADFGELDRGAARAEDPERPGRATVRLCGESQGQMV